MKKFRQNFFLWCTLSLTIVSCAKPFQPVPPEFRLWTRHGATEDDVKKALLECGYASPFDAGKNTSNNDIALAQLCMENVGYSLDPEFHTFCWHYPSLDACKPANKELIPTPSIDKRMNGPYCTNKTYATFPVFK